MDSEFAPFDVESVVLASQQHHTASSLSPFTYTVLDKPWVSQQRATMSEQKQPLINNGGASYRESLDEDLDPRYATESYQHQPSSNNVVFDAASAVESQQPSRGASTWQQQQQHQQPTSFQGGSGGGGGGLSHSFGTSQSWSLSSICAIAWALPPFSSAFVLIWETENDLARFHAYQAGLSGVGLIVLLWVLRTVLGLKTIGLLVGMGAYGWFWVNASTAHKSAPSLSRNPYLPHIGDVASRWVGEE